jgi:transcriptional regulator with XRE-family HTH domain
MNPKFAATLRAKKLGILLKDARIASGKTMKECAAVLGLSGSTISAYERGSSSPTLAELEVLSLFFKVPIERFWKEELLDSEEVLPTGDGDNSYFLTRNQQIGNQISQARINRDKTYEEITEATGITYGRMKRFEAGEPPIPLPELELLTNFLELPLNELFETDSDLGKWLNAQSSIKDFLELPPDLTSFVTNPINQPYLEIAMNLSKLSAEQLRTIAESLLEITI